MHACMHVESQRNPETEINKKYHRVLDSNRSFFKIPERKKVIQCLTKKVRFLTRPKGCTYSCTYVRTYVRTCVRTYVRTYVHTNVRTYIRTYVRTNLFFRISSDSKRGLGFEKGLWLRKGTLASKRDFGFGKGREFDFFCFFKQLIS